MMSKVPATVEWSEDGGGVVRMIDQTLLPGELVMLDCREVEEVAQAIERLSVRGAPAIGCAAALGMALAARRSQAQNLATLLDDLSHARERLAATRPTAVNLFWALAEIDDAIEAGITLDPDGDVWLTGPSLTAEPDDVRAAILQRANEIVADDLQRCIAMGQHALELIPEGANILTHCNAGALATAGYGTALGVIRAAHAAGKNIHVWVDETRPLLQGARLTAWELMTEGIPCTLICDNMAGHVMKQGRVDCVVVGSDRITATGDVANKIGTYTVAALADRHDVPFYVAAPVSTIDYELRSGDDIPIEERNPDEVAYLAHRAPEPVCPKGVAIFNPAFDVTPAELVAAIVTEKGVARPPYEESLAAMR
jgi:methylthioribose-1-phosphate isomerase